MQIIKISKNIINNDYSFSVVAKVLSVITGLLYSVLFARYLGTELRGEAAVILNYAELISLVLCLGIYQAYPYFKKTTGRDIYIEFVNYVFGLFFFFFLIGVFVSFIIPMNTGMIVATLLSPVLMAIKQLNYVVLIENPKLRNTANIKLDIFDIVLLSILLATTTANYLLCIIFLIIKHLVYFIIAIRNLKLKFSAIRPTLKGIKPYVQYGMVPMLTVLLMEINYKVDVVMLEVYDVSKSEIGIYSLGVMLAQRLWMVPDALKDILLSKLAKGRSFDAVPQITRLSLFIMLACVVIMILIGKPLIMIMYGVEFISAYEITLIIMLGVIGMVFYKMVYSYNVVNGHKNVNFIFLLVAAMTNVVLNMLLIPMSQSTGAAIASLLSYSLCGISFLIYFKKKTGVKIINMLVVRHSDIKQLKQKFIK